MARKRRGRSLTEDVYEAVRRDILFGRRAPGSRLQLNELAEEHEVSLSVVREAVTRLASEELVEATPQRGFRVRSLSLDELRDLTWVRVQVETLALRESIAKGDVGWEADLVAAHHRLAATPMFFEDGTGNTAWMEAHGAFHAALAAGAGQPDPRAAAPTALRRVGAVPLLVRAPSAPGGAGRCDRGAQGDLRRSAGT